MKIKYDPILNKLREKDVIKQLDSDPSSPTGEEAWVLRTVVTGGAGSGEPYGLLLTLTQPGDDSETTYEFSYRTKEGTTVRTELT